VPELETSVFLIPSQHAKNNTDRVVVLHEVAKSVVDAVRRHHPEFAFTHNRLPLTGINNSGWKTARRRAAARYEVTRLAPSPNGFRHIRIRTHYSAAEISNLVVASNRACDTKSRNSPALFALRSTG